MIQIDNDIAVPEGPAARTNASYPFAAMQVNQSFGVTKGEHTLANLRAAARRYMQRAKEANPESTFTLDVRDYTRPSDGVVEVRCWRTA